MPENELDDLCTAPRAVVGATALVASGSPETATNHFVYDLSTSGASLCGRPDLPVGGSVDAILELPNDRVHVSGTLSQCVSACGRPGFELHFDRLFGNAEDKIRDSIEEALARPSYQRSVLLFRDRRDYHESDHWSWLDPILSICEETALPSEGCEILENQPIRLGIVEAGRRQTRLPLWASCYPRVTWRSVDDSGRLHRVEAPGDL